jgi:hypothetical protein
MFETLTPPYVPPVPPQTPHVRVQPPVVYVRPQWEYKHVATETAPDEAALNALGAEGWEMVGAVPLHGAVHFYFKRLVR